VNSEEKKTLAKIFKELKFIKKEISEICNAIIEMTNGIKEMAKTFTTLVKQPEQTNPIKAEAEGMFR